LPSAWSALLAMLCSRSSRWGSSGCCAAELTAPRPAPPPRRRRLQEEHRQTTSPGRRGRRRQCRGGLHRRGRQERRDWGVCLGQPLNLDAAREQVDGDTPTLHLGAAAPALVGYAGITFEGKGSSIRPTQGDPVGSTLGGGGTLRRDMDLFPLHHDGTAHRRISVSHLEGEVRAGGLHTPEPLNL